MLATRRRIVEAALALHEERGPARTTISAIAERAGVERLTVYRHFPDARSLLGACSTHWLAANPPPDPKRWAAIRDPDRRIRRALKELYAYYRRTERMTSRLLRDVIELPELAELMTGFDEFLAAAAEALVGQPDRRRGSGSRLARAAVAHALRFETWHLLTRAGVDDRQAVELMARLVRSAHGERLR